jgi:hypothetical protein
VRGLGRKGLARTVGTTAPARAGAVVVCAALLGPTAGSTDPAVAWAGTLPAHGDRVARPPYRDGPPVGFSGGFGEDSCQACHFEAEVNQPPGAVVLAGVPRRYVSGEAYPLTVTLTRPGVAVGGFMLTARLAGSGAQAGVLSVAADEGPRVSISTDPESGVQYAHQRADGSSHVTADTMQWTVLWSAPDLDGGGVLLHVSALAADGDDSASGDHVFTTWASVGPR